MVIYLSSCDISLRIQGREYNKIDSLYSDLLMPFPASFSIGCLRAVMSLKVSKKRMTASFPFFIGAICNKSHSGVPVKKNNFLIKIYEKRTL